MGVETQGMRSHRNRIGAALVVCASLASFVGTAQADPRTETKTYYAASVVSLAPNCALSGNVNTGDPNPDTGVGGVCFPVNEGETSATFQIEDATGLPVGGEAYFLDASGTFREPLVLFCDHGSVEIPEGVAALVVATDVLGLAACFPGASVPGTTGTITATIS